MQPGERSIFERGCLRAGEEWLELNLVPVAGTIVSTMVLQVFYTPNYFYFKTTQNFLLYSCVTCLPLHCFVVEIFLLHSFFCKLA